MRETGLIVMSERGGTLFHLSLQEGRLVKQVIQDPCGHAVWLLCVQVAGREYLALSCHGCRNIRLMNLNKQKGNSSESQLMQYEVITAFSGEKVRRMCHGEENKIYALSSDGAVLELDISTKTFTKVKTINIGSTIFLYGLCNVPDPHRHLVVSNENGVRAVSCDDNKEAWRVKNDDWHGGKLAYTPTHESIIVADRYRNIVVILSPSDGSRLQSIQLPNNVCGIQALYVYNNQLIVCSADQISYFSLKWMKLSCSK